MPDFELFKRGSRQRSGSNEPYVSIQKRGPISISPATYARLAEAGLPKDEADRLHVELLFAPAERIVGIRPAKPGPFTYPIRSQPGSSSRVVSGRAFAVHNGIPIEKTRRYKVRELEGGVFGFALDGDEVKK